MPGVVIVGTGLAGAQAAIALRQKSYTGTITIIGDELEPPYQRPPLSKEYLKGSLDATALALRPERFWREKQVELIVGTRVSRVDREARTVTLGDGRVVEFDHLVLATGAANRALPNTAHLEGVLDLRTIDDARALQPRLGPGLDLVVIGGGFIGMEVAAAASERGARVTVVEALDRVMARVVSPQMSAFFQALHESHGVRVLTDRRVERLEGHGRVDRVLLQDGEAIEADLAVVGIGVIPNVELAEQCDLEVGDGIVVDEHLLTKDPHISAIGDCAFYPCSVSGRAHRLESIQNATDQARCVAARLTGEPGLYVAVPWFWTEQFGRKLQIAGAAPAGADAVLRGDADAAGFSVCRFAEGRLAAVESVDQPADHMAARRLLVSDAAATVTPQQVADATTSLKSLIPLAVSG
ncbi:MAG TPA: FAD-dependent oxidoreductase [Baekduia sp.]|nr:FAD-dependent oxidoreductase [Baekduia sp.]